VPRRVTLVAVDDHGAVLGALAPFDVELPWWSEIESVVDGAREHHAVDVVVLRLLEARPPGDPLEMGGDATYAVERRGEAQLRPVDARVAALATSDDPLRLPYARPGGPARELAWAESVLATHGRASTGAARQMRTWNLSSIWQIPTAAGPVWLKSVPPFFAHEGAVIERLADPALPPLLGFEPGRVLMDDIPGVDHYDAAERTIARAITTLVGIQDRVANEIDALFGLGLPDWRGPALRALATDVVERHAPELVSDERDALDRLLATFDARTAEIDACGLPITIVHGDFHPGNLRGDPDAPTLLDWGDCGVGHPLLDHPALFTSRAAAHDETLRAHWANEWRARRPGCEPERAAARIRPIAALRQAVIYRGFLDHIEASERIYHEADPARWLRIAAAET
jgi:Ser/Thr protein kinase RdoA (MazF antagonist)